MNKHLKCAIKLPLTLIFLPIVGVVWMLVFLPTTLIQMVLDISGCLDTDLGLDVSETIFGWMNKWRQL